MSKILKLQGTAELTPIETILIDNIYTLLNRREAIITAIVQNADDYKIVLEAANELRYITMWDGMLTSLKMQFFKHASVRTLEKIVNEEKFKAEYNFQDDFTIPKVVLKDFRYGEEVKQSDEKAVIAKKLGAKIVV